jgi:hypothetical protein
MTLRQFHVGRIKQVFLGAAGMTLAAVPVASALATPPGRNGQIAFVRYAHGAAR